MDKELKLYLNSLKYPICSDQIDIFNIQTKQFSCSNFRFHYVFEIDDNLKMRGERVEFNNEQHSYIINQFYEDHFNDNQTYIIVSDVDIEGNVLKTGMPLFF